MEAMTQSASATGEEDLVASEYLTFTWAVRNMRSIS
jgi:hypothetical protein